MSALASQFSWLALLTCLANLLGKLALEAAGIDRAPFAAGFSGRQQHGLGQKSRTF